MFNHIYLEVLGVFVVSMLLAHYTPAWSQRVRYQGPDGRLYFTSLPLPPPLQPQHEVDNTASVCAALPKIYRYRTASGSILLTEVPPSPGQPQHEVGNTGSAVEEIPLRRVGGIYELPVEINGVLTLHFTVDTGASEVNIPDDVARTLYRAGTIQATDFLPGKTYVLADGSTLQSARFLLQSLKIGHHRITNVSASIGSHTSALLLGQNVLEQLGTWGIDSQRKVLRLGIKIRKGQPLPHTTLSATTIRQAQERLHAAGFDPGPTDGVLGMRTQEALCEYQRVSQLPVTGSPDRATLAALGVQ